MQIETIEPSGEAAFVSFVSDRSSALVRTAWLLTGSEASAYDLVQTALLKAWTRWAAVRLQGAPEAYVRAVMLSVFLSGRRRRWAHETPSPEVEVQVTGDDRDPIEEVATRLTVQDCLRALSAGQRAVLVLRYFDDLSEAETAAALNCSVGTVKSQAARALARLRADPRLAQVWKG